MSELTEVFGNSMEVRVIIFFLEHPVHDFTKTEMAIGAGVCRQSVYKVIDKLVDFKVIRLNRRIGNAKLYCLFLGTPVVDELMALFKLLRGIE